MYIYVKFKLGDKIKSHFIPHEEKDTNEVFALLTDGPWQR